MWLPLRQMPAPIRMTAVMRARVPPTEKRLFEKAARLAGLDFSEFLRQAANEKIERMRAEGKRL